MRFFDRQARARVGAADPLPGKTRIVVGIAAFGLFVLDAGWTYGFVGAPAGGLLLGLLTYDEELGTLAVQDGKESAAADGDGSRGDEPAFACVPVRTADRVVGAVAILASRGDASASLGGPELETLRKLALYVALAWERAHGAEESAPAPATADPATGLIVDEVYQSFPTSFVISRTGYREKKIADARASGKRYAAPKPGEKRPGRKPKVPLPF